MTEVVPHARALNDALEDGGDVPTLEELGVDSAAELLARDTGRDVEAFVYEGEVPTVEEIVGDGDAAE